MMGKVSVHSPCAWLLPLPLCRIRAALEAMLRHSPDPQQSVELFVVRDAAVTACNKKHLGCKGPTNILSFPARDDSPQAFGSAREPASSIPATLVLSVDCLRREAFLYGQDPAEYLLWLLAHGMGHLMGFDHGPAMDAVSGRFFACAVSACSDQIATPQKKSG